MSALTLDVISSTEAQACRQRSRIVIRSLPPAQNHVLRLLEGLLPVDFIAANQEDCLGEIIPGDKLENPRSGIPGRSTLQLPQLKTASTHPDLSAGEVRFEDDPEVPFPFRGRQIVTNVPVHAEPLRLQKGERLLASNSAGPVWTVSIAQGARYFRSAFGLPEIGAGGNLRDAFSPENFLAMLPVIHFLRELAFPGRLPLPPLRACFIFDDPNLHRPTYGLVDFKEIAARALREHYHVSFATIPLDCWYAHGPTTRIFRENTRTLSLLVHGNDHLYHELAGDYPREVRIDLLRQALQRIQRFEQKTGLTVSRVMVPPHGACSEAMLEELPGSGFEAACISHGSLRAHNKDKAWTQALGFSVAEWIQGCPVIPRWGVSGNVTNTVLLAAFLGQAIILRGHHQDLKPGLEVLDGPARLINSLGPVTWCDMAGISRMNFVAERKGNDCLIKPFARRMELQLPAGATGLLIRNPGGLMPDWEISSGVGDTIQATGNRRVALEETATRIAIKMIQPPASGKECLPRLPKARAVVRRILTEARDRFAAFR